LDCVFYLYFYFSEWGRVIVHQEVVSIEVDAGDGGLTAEFWAVFEENILGG
jgi:hypothetical protein